MRSGMRSTGHTVYLRETRGSPVRKLCIVRCGTRVAAARRSARRERCNRPCKTGLLPTSTLSSLSFLYHSFSLSLSLSRPALCSIVQCCTARECSHERSRRCEGVDGDGLPSFFSSCIPSERLILRSVPRFWFDLVAPFDTSLRIY